MPPREALDIRGRTIQSGYDLLRSMGQATQAAGESLSRAATLDRLRAMDKARLEMERVGLEREFRRQEAVRIKGEMEGRGYLDASEGKPFDPKVHDPVQYRMGRPVFLQRQAYQQLSALPSLDAVLEFEPQDEFQGRARKERIAELVDIGELERKKEADKEKDEAKAKKADASASITAASAPEELDRIDTLGDPSLGMMAARRRKVLEHERDLRLGAALGGYEGDVDGLAKHLDEKGEAYTPEDLVRGQEIVLKRQAYKRIEEQMKAAEAAEKKEGPAAARLLYASSASALGAQIDDIEKKAVVRNMVTGEVSYDASKLTPEDRTILVRLKGDRLRAVDALTRLATEGGSEALSDADLAAELKRLTEEAVRRRQAGK